MAFSFNTTTAESWISFFELVVSITKKFKPKVAINSELSVLESTLESMLEKTEFCITGVRRVDRVIVDAINTAGPDRIPSIAERRRRVIVVYLCVYLCVCVCVCTLVDLRYYKVWSYGKATCGKIMLWYSKLMWRFSKNILVAEKSQSKAYRSVAILKFLRFCWCQQKTPNR